MPCRPTSTVTHGVDQEHPVSRLSVTAAVEEETLAFGGPLQPEILQFPIAEMVEAISGEATNGPTHEAGGEIPQIKAIHHAAAEQTDTGTDRPADPAIRFLLAPALLQLALDEHLFIEAAELQALNLHNSMAIGIAAAINRAAMGQR